MSNLFFILAGIAIGLTVYYVRNHGNNKNGKDNF